MVNILTHKHNHASLDLLIAIILFFSASLTLKAAELDYTVSWIGNSFSGADNKWVQNFFIHMNVRPDGSCVSWSHWDEGGKRFGIYKDGDVIGNKDVGANSLEVKDKQARQWKLDVKYIDPKHNEWDFEPRRITCNGQQVTFPDLHCPTALALANDGRLMIADSWTSPRQQVLFYDVSEVAAPKLVRTFGEYGGIGSGIPGRVMPTKFWGIRGIGMDAESNVYVAMSEMGSVLRKFTPEGKLVWELWVNRMSDGKELGVFDPGPTLGGVENTGWIDILTGITAHKRKKGEYLIFVEEDYKAKAILYRWRPSVLADSG